MKKYLDILKKCPLFDQIGDQDLISLLGCLGAKIETFDKKYTIFAEGAPAKHIGVILSGCAQIHQVDYHGNRSILTNIHTSEVFGEAFACARVSALPVAVTASEPCEVMLIEHSRISNICNKHCSFHQQLIFNLMKILATKAIVFHQKIEITSKRTTREKLMAYLILQAKKCDSNRFDIPFDRQELADYLQVDRSGLSAEISKLRKEGVLESHKKHFTLLFPH